MWSSRCSQGVEHPFYGGSVCCEWLGITEPAKMVEPNGVRSRYAMDRKLVFMAVPAPERFAYAAD